MTVPSAVVKVRGWTSVFAVPVAVAPVVVGRVAGTALPVAGVDLSLHPAANITATKTRREACIGAILTHFSLPMDSAATGWPVTIGGWVGWGRGDIRRA